MKAKVANSGYEAANLLRAVKNPLEAVRNGLSTSSPSPIWKLCEVRVIEWCNKIEIHKCDTQRIHHRQSQECMLPNQLTSLRA